MAYKTQEQIAAEVLIPIGFILDNGTLLPYSFADKEGHTITSSGRKITAVVNRNWLYETAAGLL